MKNAGIKAQLEEKLIKAFPEGNVCVETSDDVHFSAHIVDSSFKGLGLIAQHRLVYQAIGDMMGKECHALSISTQEREEC